LPGATASLSGLAHAHAGRFGQCTPFCSFGRGRGTLVGGFVFTGTPDADAEAGRAGTDTKTGGALSGAASLASLGAPAPASADGVSGAAAAGGGVAAQRRPTVKNNAPPSAGNHNGVRGSASG
jgi:hypothetical protein